MTLSDGSSSSGATASMEEFQNDLDEISNELDNSGCPSGRTGAECSIPYEICPDGKRRCFNNSQCARIDAKDQISEDYKYRCDCSFAETVSKYAGHQCEYSATAYCQPGGGSHGVPKRGHNYHHFCTNGGLCEEFVLRANLHIGCNCPRDFAGAHCQYLKALVDINDIENEALFPDVGDNFYAFTPRRRNGNNLTGFTLALSLVILFGIGFLFVKATIRRRNIRKGRRFTSVATGMEMAVEVGKQSSSVGQANEEVQDGKNVMLQANQPNAEII